MSGTKQGKKPSEYVIVAVIILVAVGVIGVGGFYQSEIFTYVGAQGWNLGQYESAAKSFVTAANSGDGDAVSKMLSPGMAQFKVTSKQGKLTGFHLPIGKDPVDVPFKKLCPTADASFTKPTLNPTAGDASVLIKFRTHTLDTHWKPGAGGPQLIFLAWGV
jgi:hypothetical protein